jgi:hypothetical protein
LSPICDHSVGNLVQFQQTGAQDRHKERCRKQSEDILGQMLCWKVLEKYSSMIAKIQKMTKFLKPGLNPSVFTIVLAQLNTLEYCPVDLSTMRVFNTSIGYIQVCAMAPAVAPAKNRCVFDGSAPQKLFLIVSKMPNLRPVSGKIFMTFTKFPRHSDLIPPSEYINCKVFK